MKKWEQGSLFQKVALRNLKKNRAGTFVTVVGAMLSAALFTGIAAFGTSLVHHMAEAEIAKRGNWHIVFSDVPAEQKGEWAEDNAVEEAVSYENIGYAILEGAGKQSAEKPYLFLAGFSDETIQALPVSLTAGRMPENSGEIAVPAGSIAIKAGVKLSLGDRLRLSVGERMESERRLSQCVPYRAGERLADTEEKTYTVVGIFERAEFELHDSPGYTVITKADGKTQADRCSLYLALKKPAKIFDYAEGKNSAGSYGINESLLRFMGISENRLFNAFLYVIGGILAAIIMTGSVFLIYNAFSISLNERVHQYGILMSVGATAKQLQRSVLYEGLCIGCIGIPLGMLAGLGCVGMLLPTVSGNFSSMLEYDGAFRLYVSVPALAACAVISLLTILFSAYLPARRAAAMPIMDCIRQTGEIKTEERDVRLSGYAWRLYGLEGTLAVKNFRRNKKRYRSVILSLTLSVALTVTGSSFVTTLTKIMKEYTVETADGDVLLMTQDMTIEAFREYYDQAKTLSGVERSTWQADFIYKGETEELPADFLAVYREETRDDSVGDIQQMTLYTRFVEDVIYEEWVESLGLPLEEYTGEAGKVFGCLMNAEKHTTYFDGETMRFLVGFPEGADSFEGADSPEGADSLEGAVSPEGADSLEGAVSPEGVTSPETGTSPENRRGMELDITFENNYPIDDTFILEDDPVYVMIVTAPLSAMPRFAGIQTTDGLTHLGATFWTGTPTQVISQIRALLMDEKVTADYTLVNLARAFELFRSVTSIVSIFTAVFLGMIALISVANVLNTISTNIRLRRRELAMLRSVGLSDSGLKRMLCYECALYGLRTLCLGIPVSLLLSWGIYKAAMYVEKMDSLAFSAPWGAMCTSVLGVFGIILLTMLYAAGKIRKENIMDALRDETV